MQRVTSTIVALATVAWISNAAADARNITAEASAKAACLGPDAAHRLLSRGPRLHQARARKSLIMRGSLLLSTSKLLASATSPGNAWQVAVHTLAS
jgi:hypothetical protein